jgi:uncharacterized membrane protein
MFTQPMEYVLLGLRYMHILGAIALMGGTIFARFAVLPALGTLSDEVRFELHGQLRRRWAHVVRLAALFLLISGIANLGIYGAMYEFPTFSKYNMIAGIKFVLALPIFFIAELLTGKSKLALRIQEKPKFWLSVNLLLALSMVFIGGGLRFAERRLKSEKKAAAVVQENETTHRHTLAANVRN